MKKKLKNALDEFDEALLDLQAEHEKRNKEAYKEGIGIGMMIVAIIFGVLCSLLHL